MNGGRYHLPAVLIRRHTLVWWAERPLRGGVAVRRGDGDPTTIQRWGGVWGVCVAGQAAAVAITRDARTAWRVAYRLARRTAAHIQPEPTAWAVQCDGRPVPVSAPIGPVNL